MHPRPSRTFLSTLQSSALSVSLDGIQGHTLKFRQSGCSVPLVTPSPTLGVRRSATRPARRSRALLLAGRHGPNALAVNVLEDNPPPPLAFSVLFSDPELGV